MNAGLRSWNCEDVCALFLIHVGAFSDLAVTYSSPSALKKISVSTPAHNVWKKHIICSVPVQFILNLS